MTVLPSSHPSFTASRMPLPQKEVAPDKTAHVDEQTVQPVAP